MRTKEALKAEAEIAAEEVVVSDRTVWAYTILTKADTPAAQVGMAILALPQQVWIIRQAAIWAAEEAWEAIIKAGIRTGSPKLRWRSNFLDSTTIYAEPAEWVFVQVYPVVVVDER